MNKTVLATVLALIAVLSIAVVFFTRPHEPPAAPSEAPVVQSYEPRNITARVTVTTQYFSPANITVRAADELWIEFTSADANHTLLLPVTSEQATIPLGSTKKVRVEHGRDVALLCTTCTSEPFMVYVR